MEPEDLKTLSDLELEELHTTVINDLIDAAEKQNESEWHQACFAAAVLVSQEVNARKAKH